MWEVKFIVADEVVRNANFNDTRLKKLVPVKNRFACRMIFWINDKPQKIIHINPTGNQVITYCFKCWVNHEYLFSNVLEFKKEAYRNSGLKKILFQDDGKRKLWQHAWLQEWREVNKDRCFFEKEPEKRHGNFTGEWFYRESDIYDMKRFADEKDYIGRGRPNTKFKRRNNQLAPVHVIEDRLSGRPSYYIQSQTGEMVRVWRSTL